MKGKEVLIFLSRYCNDLRKCYSRFWVTIIGTLLLFYMEQTDWSSLYVGKNTSALWLVSC